MLFLMKLSPQMNLMNGLVVEEDGKLYATGGRVLLCVGVGESIKEARDRAYLLCGQVHFAGKQFRNDIAYQALRQ